MKRIISMTLLVIMCLSMCACNETSPHNMTIRFETPAANPNAGNNTSKHTPPEDEYDEIILKDDRYILCMRDDTGFTSNTKSYGIYDTQLGKWAMDFTPLIDIYETEDSFNFKSHGNGVFSYYSRRYESYDYFLSAELNGIFRVKDLAEDRTSVYFDDSDAFILVDMDRGYVDGKYLAPDEDLYLLSTDGSLEKVVVPGFAPDALLYWYRYFLITNSSQMYLRCFYTYDYDTRTRTYYIYVYLHEAQKALVIEHNEYASRMNASDVYAYLNDGIIRICNMRGDDGKKYYAEFDIEGNLVTTATPMS